MNDHLADSVAWYCIRTQPKHEHIAAAHLALISSLEVFCPRLRFQRQTVNGPKWFVEAMFPGYLFARFSLETDHLRVRYSPGVTKIVQFGTFYARIEDEVIEGIRQWAEQAPAKNDQIEVGERVEIATGALQGLEAVLTQTLPGKERVRVLVEFLGRQIEAELASPSIMAMAR